MCVRACVYVCVCVCVCVCTYAGNTAESSPTISYTIAIKVTDLGKNNPDSLTKDCIVLSTRQLQANSIKEPSPYTHGTSCTW